MENKELQRAEFRKTIVIAASPDRIWAALTQPGLMKQWMTETEIDITTSWQVGSPLIIQGDWYKTKFENKGIVLAYEPFRELAYSHLSSLSRLPDKTESYSVLTFTLAAHDGATGLTLKLNNFPTETIYRHLAFYWNVAMELLKKFVEQ